MHLLKNGLMPIIWPTGTQPYHQGIFHNATQHFDHEELHLIFRFWTSSFNSHKQSRHMLMLQYDKSTQIALGLDGNVVTLKIVITCTGSSQNYSTRPSVSAVLMKNIRCIGPVSEQNITFTANTIAKWNHIETPSCLRVKLLQKSTLHRSEICLGSCWWSGLPAISGRKLVVGTD